MTITKRRRLIIVREEIGDCRRCPLHAGRKNIVFGSGDVETPLMFIGEAPGEEEDMWVAPAPAEGAAARRVGPAGRARRPGAPLCLSGQAKSA